jgi:hypothetical protein
MSPFHESGRFDEQETAKFRVRFRLRSRHRRRKNWSKQELRLPDNNQVAAAVRQWVDTVVVGLNLCPFAKRELDKDRARFVISDAITEQGLLVDLEAELDLLEKDASIATTLLIHPRVLETFYDYNQFLNYAEGLLQQMELDGVYQIASFHPDYQFGGTEPDDAENYTNRSPYPILHLLREESLDRVLESTEYAEQIPIRNIKLMNTMGSIELSALLKACLDLVELD